VTSTRPAADIDTLVTRAREGDARSVARLISLVENASPALREVAAALAPHTGRARVIGLTGSPGVGKSTSTSMLVRALRGQGNRVGVLAVDPSSPFSGGALLGDRVRMQDHATDSGVFIRSMASRGHLGGLAAATPQAVRVLDAAGCDVVLVETVGVGQSEVTVAGMVDTFLFLTLARTGDQLQGIKKGILEIADVIAVNKADGDRADEARAAAKELSGALRLVHRGSKGWVAPVLTCSGLEDTGVDDVWARVLEHRESLGQDGLEAKRADQQLEFTWTLVRDELQQRLRRSAGVKEVREEIRAAVLAGDLPATLAADRILAAYDAG
jgi:LAO/AO transport system kinase